jgi:hypothetical protein
LFGEIGGTGAPGVGRAAKLSIDATDAFTGLSVSGGSSIHFRRFQFGDTFNEGKVIAPESIVLGPRHHPLS